MLKRIMKISLVCFVTAIVALIMAAGVFLVSKSILGIDALGAERYTDIDAEDPDDMTSNDAQRMNFLLLGRDRSSGLCDVIMLVSYDTADRNVNVLQIPRDTYAEFTETSYKKLNGALGALGGERELCAFLSESFGIRIDHYVSLDLDAVKEIVDALGGVEVNVPCDMRYSDAEQGLYIDIKAGKNMLDGDMAEKFVRFRSEYAEGDIGRMDAQKIFLAALFNKLKNNASVFEIGSVAARIVPHVKTSLSLTEILPLVKQVLAVPSENIRLSTLAGEGAVAKKSGASYYVISRPSAIEQVRELFGSDIDESGFDRKRLFLNEEYDEFVRIYSEGAEYTVYDVSYICREGINIARK